LSEETGAEIMASISFNVGTTTSISHNNRENLHGNPNIKDRIADNITYVQEDIRALYDREFSEAVLEYNANQKSFRFCSYFIQNDWS